MLDDAGLVELHFGAEPLKSRADVKSNKDSVARLDSQLKVTRAFYDVGLRPRLDVLQAESDLAACRAELEATRRRAEA